MSPKPKPKKIDYPYIPPDHDIKYVHEDNSFIQMAKIYAQTYSLDDAVPTGSVVVISGKVVGKGANGSNYHKDYPCSRVQLGIPTGQQYELCEGCHPKNHSEPRALTAAFAKGHDL